MRYALKNMADGPRYLFTKDGVAPIIAPGQTGEPAEFHDAELAEARKLIDPLTNKPVWEITEVADDDDADDDDAPKGRGDMSKAELIAEVERLRADGKTVTLVDADGNTIEAADGKADTDSSKATKAVLVAALDKADPQE